MQQVFWDKKFETLQAEQLKFFQLEAFKKTLLRAKKSHYYQKKLKNIQVDSLKSMDCIQDLPFTEKQDLRDDFPYGFLAVDLEDCIRMHSSSGTTGTPTVVFYSRKDINDWAELIARCMTMSGASKKDVFQNTMGHGLFTGGLGFHYGAEKIGMTTIPFGPGNSARQIWFMQQFKTTVLHILPSYALHLYSTFEELKLAPKTDTSLRIAYIGAEPHSEKIRQKIEELYGIKAYNSYGLSEICGPGVAFECSFQNGMHLWEDHFYPEIINPQTGRVLPDGEPGELVLTHLQKEAMPLIRYRTKDLTRIIPEQCACGRTHRRIERIKGRSDDMLILNGVNTFPIQIEKPLMEVEGIGRNYKIEIHKKDHMDKLVIFAEVDEKFFTGDYKDLEKLKKKLINILKCELLITPEVYLVEPNSIEVLPGKVKRVFDLRKE